MHALIIADRSIALRERAMLARLEVGLADEGVRVVHAVPHACVDQVGPGIHATVVGYFEGGLAFRPLIRAKAKDLIQRVQESEESETPIDVVHAFGQGTWRLAAEIARLSNAAMLIEVWRPSLMIPAAAFVRELKHGGLAGLGLVVGESAMETALRQRVGNAAAVMTAPWGVHVSDRVRVRQAGEVLGVGVLSESGDPRSIVPALTGLRDATRDGPQTLVFADVSSSEPLRLNSTVDARSISTRESGVWTAARKLGMLDRLSLTPEMEARREPILQVDMLLLPEATGAQRTLVLEAMGAGIVIVSPSDSGLSVLNERTCALAGRGDAGAWAAAIGGVLNDPARRQALIDSARTVIRNHRSASAHIAGVLGAYSAVVTPTGATGR